MYTSTIMLYLLVTDIPNINVRIKVTPYPLLWFQSFVILYCGDRLWGKFLNQK